MSDFENKYLEKTRSIILKYINKDSIEVFLFGSRAIKTNSKYSDIDIGLLADKKIGRSIILKINQKKDKLLDMVLDMKAIDYTFIINEINKQTTELKKK